MPIPAEFTPILDRCVAQGADVVWLAGSFATGDVGPYSDLDFGVIRADAAAQRFEVWADRLVSISTTTVTATRESFRMPAVVGAAVPGWRSADLLHDPNGVGLALKEEALAWSWDGIVAECDSWVATQVTVLADEVHKLLSALKRGQAAEAAFRCNNLAARLTLVISVRQRLLYGSERRLFEMVAGDVGGDWPRMHERAMRSRPVPLDEAATGALWLYRFVSHDTVTLRSFEQESVVSFTLRSIARWELGH
jgi:hypothetical protein